MRGHTGRSSVVVALFLAGLTGAMVLVGCAAKGGTPGAPARDGSVPLDIVVTGRGAGVGTVEQAWAPLTDQYGMHITAAVYSVHVNSGMISKGNMTYAGVLSKEQEQRLIAALVPPAGQRAPDVAIIGGRVTASPDQYSAFDRLKETWHPGTLTPAVQQALVQYVKAGGKVIFSTRQVFKTEKVGEWTFAYEGGPLDEILPKDELKENLPFMDGRPRQQWGPVSFRQVGNGKVIIVDPHTPSPSRQETARKEFELWDVLIRWMAQGNTAFAVTVAADLPSRKVTAGSSLPVISVLRNYQCDEPITLRARVTDAEDHERFVRDVRVAVPPGQSRDQAMAIPTDNTWLSGRYGVAVQVLIGRDKKLVATLTEPFDVTGALDLTVQTEKDGYAAADAPVATTIQINNNLGLPYPTLRLETLFRDVNGRIFQRQQQDLTPSGGSSELAQFRFVMKDYPRGVYWIDASIHRGKECWGRASSPVYRYGKYDPGEQIIWTMWTGDTSQRWLDLFRNTGLNAISDDFAAAERSGFFIWTRNRYELQLREALAENALKARFGEQFAKPLAARRDPSVWHPSLIQVCQDGENGWPIMLKGAAQKAPFTQWLKQHYASVDDLNLAWGKSYKSWDDIEYAEPSSGYGVSVPPRHEERNPLVRPGPVDLRAGVPLPPGLVGCAARHESLQHPHVGHRLRLEPQRRGRCDRLPMRPALDRHDRLVLAGDARTGTARQRARPLHALGLRRQSPDHVHRLLGCHRGRQPIHRHVGAHHARANALSLLGWYLQYLPPLRPALARVAGHQSADRADLPQAARPAGCAHGCVTGCRVLRNLAWGRRRERPVRPPLPQRLPPGSPQWQQSRLWQVQGDPRQRRRPGDAGRCPVPESLRRRWWSARDLPRLRNQRRAWQAI